MARRVKKEKQPEPGSEGNGVAAFRGNGYDPNIVQGFVARIESQYAELATEKGEFMARCKQIHEGVKDVLTEAKNAGIPKKSLKSIIKHRKLLNDIEGIRADLEGDDQDSYDQLQSALGMLADTPLGSAALDKAA